MSTKEMALNIISEMPGDATIDDIMYLLYLQKKLESGVEDIKLGRSMNNQEVEKELESWLK